MEVECPKHPGAIGSQLLDETAPMAGKSWQPSHEPPRRREEGHPSHWYSIYSGKKGRVGGGGNNPETMLKRRMALQQTQGIHAHVDDRRLLTAHAYQCWLHACTGACAWTNNAKCKGAQTPATCTGASASQNTTGHEGTLTWVNALPHVHNKSAYPWGSTAALRC